MELSTAKGEAEDELAEFEALATRVRNWGRWGDDDEKGTLNHIGAAQRVRAAGLVERGEAISLALPIENGKGPMITGISNRFNPLHHMTVTGLEKGPVEMGGTTDITDDVLVIGCQTSTQWDALSHVYYDGRLYNGFEAASVTHAGAGHDHIEAVHREFFGRGVLLDMPRFKDEKTLPPGYAVSPAEMTACAESQGVELEQGDIVLLRTGALTRVVDNEWTAFHAEPRPGVHYSVAGWLDERRSAALASDNNAVEAPSTLAGLRNPFHMLALRDMGLHLGEFWDLERLAEDCAEDGRYEFMLVAQPLRIVGGTGSPLNPLAIK